MSQNGLDRPSPALRASMLVWGSRRSTMPCRSLTPPSDGATKGEVVRLRTDHAQQISGRHQHLANLASFFAEDQNSASPWARLSCTRCEGSNGLTQNSQATSVTRLRSYESAIARCLAFSRKILSPATSTFATTSAIKRHTPRQFAAHSIASSARASSEGRTVRPSLQNWLLARS